MEPVLSVSWELFWLCFEQISDSSTIFEAQYFICICRCVIVWCFAALLLSSPENHLAS